MEPQTRGHSFLGLFIQRKTWENHQLLDVVMLRVLRRQSSAYYATQPTNHVSAFGSNDISCRSIHVCVCQKEQTRATDTVAVANVWQSLPGVMVPCGCLCIGLSSYCQLFTCDNIQKKKKNPGEFGQTVFSDGLVHETMCSVCKLRQGKVNNYAQRQLLFFLERKNELPRAGFEPVTFCVLGERSTN